MSGLIEAVPNFSEGRRTDVITAIVDAASSVAGCRVLDVHSDSDHNRSVVTMVGRSLPLQEAVIRAVAVAVRFIDLRQHRGVHPRLGAADVVPFVPLTGATMEDAVATAHAVGERVASELGVPVYFYGEAARSDDRFDLEHVRHGGYEDLVGRVGREPDLAPDLGPSRLHESAGAVVVGARQPLIAYNVVLETTDIRAARTIARRIRHSSGGLRYVKALGLELTGRGRVQVSMNLTNYRSTALHTVYDLVCSEAASHGVSVAESELVGMIPLDAVVDAARHYLRLTDFDASRILEVRVLEDVVAE